MSTRENKRAKGSKPGTRKARFQAIADAVNDRSPASAAMVVEEDDGGHSVQDINWGGALMRVAGGGAAEYAGHSFTTGLHHTEADPRKIAEAIVGALDGYTPQN